MMVKAVAPPVMKILRILNRLSRRKRGMASNPLFIIPDFLLIYPMNLGLKEMGKRSALLAVSV